MAIIHAWCAAGTPYMQFSTNSNHFLIIPLKDRRCHQSRVRLCDQGTGGSALVLPCGRQSADGLVVPGETVDTRFDENEAELGVPILAVALKMLADSDGLYIQVNIKC